MSDHSGLAPNENPNPVSTPATMPSASQYDVYSAPGTYAPAGSPFFERLPGFRPLNFTNSNLVRHASNQYAHSTGMFAHQGGSNVSYSQPFYHGIPAAGSPSPMNAANMMSSLNPASFFPPAPIYPAAQTWMGYPNPTAQNWMGYPNPSLQQPSVMQNQGLVLPYQQQQNSAAMMQMLTSLCSQAQQQLNAQQYQRELFEHQQRELHEQQQRELHEQQQQRMAHQSASFQSSGTPSPASIPIDDPVAPSLTPASTVAIEAVVTSASSLGLAFGTFAEVVTTDAQIAASDSSLGVFVTASESASKGSLRRFSYTKTPAGCRIKSTVSSEPPNPPDPNTSEPKTNQQSQLSSEIKETSNRSVLTNDEEVLPKADEVVKDAHTHTDKAVIDAALSDEPTQLEATQSSLDETDKIQESTEDKADVVPQVVQTEAKADESSPALEPPPAPVSVANAVEESAVSSVDTATSTPPLKESNEPTSQGTSLTAEANEVQQSSGVEVDAELPATTDDRKVEASSEDKAGVYSGLANVFDLPSLKAPPLKTSIAISPAKSIEPPATSDAKTKPSPQKIKTVKTLYWPFGSAPDIKRVVAIAPDPHRRLTQDRLGNSQLANKFVCDEAFAGAQALFGLTPEQAKLQFANGFTDAAMSAIEQALRDNTFGSAAYRLRIAGERARASEAAAVVNPSTEAREKANSPTKNLEVDVLTKTLVPPSVGQAAVANTSSASAFPANPDWLDKTNKPRFWPRGKVVLFVDWVDAKRLKKTAASVNKDVIRYASEHPQLFKMGSAAEVDAAFSNGFTTHAKVILNAELVIISRWVAEQLTAEAVDMAERSRKAAVEYERSVAKGAKKKKTTATSDSANSSAHPSASAVLDPAASSATESQGAPAALESFGTEAARLLSTPIAADATVSQASSFAAATDNPFAFIDNPPEKSTAAKTSTKIVCLAPFSEGDETVFRVVELGYDRRNLDSDLLATITTFASKQHCWPSMEQCGTRFWEEGIPLSIVEKFLDETTMKIHNLQVKNQGKQKRRKKRQRIVAQISSPTPSEMAPIPRSRLLPVINVVTSFAPSVYEANPGFAKLPPAPIAESDAAAAAVDNATDDDELNPFVEPSAVTESATASKASTTKRSSRSVRTQKPKSDSSEEDSEAEGSSGFATLTARQDYEVKQLKGRLRSDERSASAASASGTRASSSNASEPASVAGVAKAPKVAKKEKTSEYTLPEGYGQIPEIKLIDGKPRNWTAGLLYQRVKEATPEEVEALRQFQVNHVQQNLCVCIRRDYNTTSDNHCAKRKSLERYLNDPIDGPNPPPDPNTPALPPSCWLPPNMRHYKYYGEDKRKERLSSTAAEGHRSKLLPHEVSAIEGGKTYGAAYFRFSQAQLHDMRRFKNIIKLDLRDFITIVETITDPETGLLKAEPFTPAPAYHRVIKVSSIYPAYRWSRIQVCEKAIAGLVELVGWPEMLSQVTAALMAGCNQVKQPKRQVKLFANEKDVVKIDLPKDLLSMVELIENGQRINVNAFLDAYWAFIARYCAKLIFYSCQDIENSATNLVDPVMAFDEHNQFNVLNGVATDSSLKHSSSRVTFVPTTPSPIVKGDAQLATFEMLFEGKQLVQTVALAYDEAATAAENIMYEEDAAECERHIEHADKFYDMRILSSQFDIPVGVHIQDAGDLMLYLEGCRRCVICISKTATLSTSWYYASTIWLHTMAQKFLEDSLRWRTLRKEEALREKAAREKAAADAEEQNGEEAVAAAGEEAQIGDKAAKQPEEAEEEVGMKCGDKHDTSSWTIWDDVNMYSINLTQKPVVRYRGLGYDISGLPADYYNADLRCGYFPVKRYLLENHFSRNCPRKIGTYYHVEDGYVDTNGEKKTRKRKHEEACGPEKEEEEREPDESSDDDEALAKKPKIARKDVATTSSAKSGGGGKTRSSVSAQSSRKAAKTGGQRAKTGSGSKSVRKSSVPSTNKVIAGTEDIFSSEASSEGSDDDLSLNDSGAELIVKEVGASSILRGVGAKVVAEATVQSNDGLNAEAMLVGPLDPIRPSVEDGEILESDGAIHFIEQIDDEGIVETVGVTSDNRAYIIISPGRVLGVGNAPEIGEVLQDGSVFRGRKPRERRQSF